MKKQTTLSVLKEIRDILRAYTMLTVKIEKLVEDIAKKEDYFKITDPTNKKTSDLLNECRAKFKVWSYYSDDILDKDFPAPKIETTRYFKKTPEPDEDLMNKSTEDLEKKGIKGCTLRERLIMELQYFSETGKNLDINNITLCSGSRFSFGFVPYVLRNSDGSVHVSRYNPQYRTVCIGARRAVRVG